MRSNSFSQILSHNTIFSVYMLCQQNCQVDAKTDKGYTALHGSILSGTLKITEKLLKYGADVNAQDNDGDTPMHLLNVSLDEMKPVTADVPELMKVIVGKI